MAKPVRLLPRLLVSIIFVLLPLTLEEQLNPTDLVSIGAGMMALMVAWETVGSLEKGAALFESWNASTDDESSDDDVEVLRREVPADVES